MSATLWRMARDRPGPAALPRRGRVGMAASTVLHAAALALLVRIVVPTPPAPPELRPVTMLFAPAAAPSALPAPAVARSSPPAMAQALPAQPPQPVARETASAAATSPIHLPQRPRVLASHSNARPTAVPVRPAPTAPANPVPAPTAAPMASGDDNSTLARLAGSINTAVQQAASMPLVARRQHREGKAQVGFSYLDGAVANVALLQSSQSRVLDDAALDAVRSARYPLPPAVLRGRRLPMQVWIDFRLHPEPVEG